MRRPTQDDAPAAVLVEPVEAVELVDPVAAALLASQRNAEEALSGALLFEHVPAPLVTAAQAMLTAEADLMRTALLAERAAAPRVISADEDRLLQIFWQREVNRLRDELQTVTQTRAQAGPRAITQFTVFLRVTKQQQARHAPSLVRVEMSKRDELVMLGYDPDSPEGQAILAQQRRPDVPGVIRVPPAGHPDHDRLAAEAQRQREAFEAEQAAQQMAEQEVARAAHAAHDRSVRAELADE